MAITVQHTHCAHVEIIFTACDGSGLHEDTVGTMDDIMEHCATVLVKHGFTHADVCDATTGEVLMIVDRSV